MANGDSAFSQNLRKYFDAASGAYSPVTDTEVKDGQLTVSGMEKELVIGAHRKIHVARFDDIVGDLDKLLDSRGALLEYAGISRDELLGLYRS